MDDPTRKRIRNSTTEFLMLTANAGDASIEARFEDETIWLSQKLMGSLFGVDVRTVNEHLKTSIRKMNSRRKQPSGNSG